MRRMTRHASGAVGHGCVNHRHTVNGGNGLLMALTAKVSITSNMCGPAFVTTAALTRFKRRMLIALQHGQSSGGRCVRVVTGHAIATRRLDTGDNMHRAPAFSLGVMTGAAQFRRRRLQERRIIRCMTIVTRQTSLLNRAVSCLGGHPFRQSRVAIQTQGIGALGE